MKLTISKFFCIKKINLSQYVIGDKMKKFIFLLLIFIIGYCMIQSTEAEGIQIPDSAIRLRVIPNSNSTRDQEVKLKVKTELENTTYELLNGVTSINKARMIISNNLDSIETGIERVLLEEEYDLGYKINFGQNYFPEKEFKGITYEAGNYESLVVTLGKGEGDNWWCVLFPPLCLLEAEESDADEVEYKFFVEELIDKYF